MRLMLYIILLILGGCAKWDKQPQEKTPAQGVVNESVDDWQASWLKDLEEYYNSLAKRVYPLASDVQALKKRLESQQYWKIVNYRPGRVVDGKVYFYYDVVNIGGASRMMMHIRGDSISYYIIVYLMTSRHLQRTLLSEGDVRMMMVYCFVVVIV